MKIDIYQDTVCPWCRIGKQHLKTALVRWQSDPARRAENESTIITYHPFFLDPDIPPEGLPFKPYMQAKGGGLRLPAEWFAGPRDAGARVGIIFDFEAIDHAPNTLLSHELIALTPLAKTEAIIDAVYTAYFEHGRNIGDLDVLVAIAEENGLDATTIRSQLENHVVRDQVLREIDEAISLGITGVPFFVINDRYAFSGAQPAESIVRLFNQVKALEDKATKPA